MLSPSVRLLLLRAVVGEDVIVPQEGAGGGEEAGEEELVNLVE